MCMSCILERWCLHCLWYMHFFYSSFRCCRSLCASFCGIHILSKVAPASITASRVLCATFLCLNACILSQACHRLPECPRQSHWSASEMTLLHQENLKFCVRTCKMTLQLATGWRSMASGQIHRGLWSLCSQQRGVKSENWNNQRDYNSAPWRTILHMQTGTSHSLKSVVIAFQPENTAASHSVFYLISLKGTVKNKVHVWFIEME